MSREIRITVEDDEVFERMRRRKDELDLSWEEVLRRGLNEGKDSPRGPGAGNHRPGPRGHPGRSRSPGPFDPGFGEYLRRQIEDQVPEPGSPDDPGDDPPGPFDPGFDEWISDRVEDTVQGAMSSVEKPLDAEIERLEGAEDATLVFDHLEDPREVPLRIDVRSSSAGFDVDVVAIRQGKGTAEMNTFDESDRKTITRHLAKGGTATLLIGDDTVSYDAYPSLEWGRDANGNPTVTNVVIDGIDLD